MSRNFHFFKNPIVSLTFFITPLYVLHIKVMQRIVIQISILFSSTVMFLYNALTCHKLE